MMDSLFPFKKRPFRFSLQSLLLLVVCFALAIGWWKDHQELSQTIHDLQHPKRGWDTDQVLGPPDTFRAGDIRTAWASKSRDGQDEWLVLDYSKAIVPKSIVVHETYNPGALSKVTAFKTDGTEVVAWEGTDPTPPTAAMGVSRIDLNIAFETKRIKIYLDSVRVAGWNEIDAVGLVGARRGDPVMWAHRAFSSSSWGKNNDLPQGWVVLSR